MSNSKSRKLSRLAGGWRIYGHGQAGLHELDVPADLQGKIDALASMYSFAQILKAISIFHNKNPSNSERLCETDIPRDLEFSIGTLSLLYENEFLVAALHRATSPKLSKTAPRNAVEEPVRVYGLDDIGLLISKDCRNKTD